MKPYLDLVKLVLETGRPRRDRTGVGTRSVFGHQIRFDLNKGFPLLAARKIHTRSLIVELLWFLRGETNIQYLHDHKVTIWDEWADERGDLGPVYGRQWRAWQTADGRTVDQIAQLLGDIKANPDSRRLIVNAWNVGDIQKMALPPCHALFQFYVEPGDERPDGSRELGRLSCQLYQRSADLFLGVPFNTASYALLTHMIAHVCGLNVGDFIHTFGDVHLYENHLDQARELLSRTPKPMPMLRLNPRIRDLFAFQPADIEILAYDPHPPISAPVAV